MQLWMHAQMDTVAMWMIECTDEWLVDWWEGGSDKRRMRLKRNTWMKWSHTTVLN